MLTMQSSERNRQRLRRASRRKLNSFLNRSPNHMVNAATFRSAGSRPGGSSRIRIRVGNYFGLFAADEAS